MIDLNIPFKKSHEIGGLITNCELKDNQISTLYVEADQLTDYAVAVRYPDDLFVPNPKEAKEAYELAKKLRDYILPKSNLTK